MALNGKGTLRAAIAVLGLFISVLLIASVFVQVSWDGLHPTLIPRFDLAVFAQQLPRQLPWVLAFALASALVLPARAVQWQSTLERPVAFRERYHLVAIGAFVHNVLPGKLGDAFRAFAMARTQRLPFLQSLASVAVCKLLEFAALMTMVGLIFLGPFARTLGDFSSAVKASIALTAVLLGLVIALARYSKHWAAALERRGQFKRLQAVLQQAGDGFASARSAKGLLRALALSVPPVAAAAGAYAIGLWGLGVKESLFGGVVVLGAISLGQSFPGLPIGPGISYFVTGWVARLLGASPVDAAAFATLTQTATLLTQISVGAVSLKLRRLRWSELKHNAGAAAEAAHEAR